MLRMLIADDEPVIIKGLQLLIDWQELGIEICVTCENGSDALREIFATSPDLALLDISMPGKTGIEILKALHAMQSRTKVIFISGFQDFSYAHDALSYGAVDYLLKPVKKDELLHAIQKILPVTVHYEEQPAQDGNSSLTDALARAAVVSPTRYVLAAVQPLGLTGRNEMEMQLIKFSFYSQLDTLCQQEENCYAFLQGEHSYLLLTNRSAEEAIRWLHTVQGRLSNLCGCTVGFAVSSATTEVNVLPEYIWACRDTCVRYFYFDGWLPDTVLAVNQSPFGADAGDTTLLRPQQEEIVNTFVDPDRTACQALIDRYIRTVVRVADGRADAAVYHLLVCRRMVQERLEKTGIRCAGGSNEFLDAAREASDYRAVTELFQRSMDDLYEQIQGQVHRNEHKDIHDTTDYIAAHYRENLTLEMLAGRIHMNPNYFSSYFKKQVGQNYKDYLNRIRMDHALELLLGTDMRSYEIAEEVGFKDYRYFNELFSRYYGKTPTAYRKEMLAGRSGETAQ